MEPRKVTADEVKGWLDSGEPVAFVDVRSEHAWQSTDRVPPGTIHIPIAEVRQRLGEIPRDQAVVTYCT